MRRLTGYLFFAVLLLLLFFGQAISLYTDWLWFQEVGFTQVFNTILFFKLILALLVGGLFALVVYFNVKLAARVPRGVRFVAQDEAIELPSTELIDPVVQPLILPLALLLGFFAAPQAAKSWESFLLFLNPVPFGLTDPLMGHDIGFYVFRLPALTTLYGWLTFGLGFTLLATGFTYFLYRGIQYTERGLFLTERARSHLLCLIGCFLLVKSGGYVLDTFELLYSPRGAAFGASYTDLYANLPALRALIFLAAVAADLSLPDLSSGLSISSRRRGAIGREPFYRVGSLPVVIGEVRGLALLSRQSCQQQCPKLFRQHDCVSRD